MDIEVPTGKKGISQLLQPMEELIKMHARHLADIDDIIWDNREGEIVCHVGICSVCQLKAFVLSFPRVICKSPGQI